MEYFIEKCKIRFNELNLPNFASEINRHVISEVRGEATRPKYNFTVIPPPGFG